MSGGNRVIVVGAGPVGLVAAMRLAGFGDDRRRVEVGFTGAEGNYGMAFTT